MYEPLASRLRPRTFDDVVGQTRVIRLIRRMIAEDKVVSMILYGPTGTGKTTIAMLVAEHFPLNNYKFNASTDTKATLKEIVETTKLYGSILLVIDEIHRMNRDIQDYLLPFVESGRVVMLGLTTENPYIACNPAIRSRATIFRLERLSSAEIRVYLEKIDLSFYEKELTIGKDAYDYLATAANGEIRTAVNMLEMIAIQAEPGQAVDAAFAVAVVGKPSVSVDKNGDDYYDILSAYHKSVRGSDVDAALHYLSRLIVAEDLESLLRRISAIVYEDIGLANPAMGSHVAAACDIARHIGFPEAVNALGAITIEMCISPKSNAAHLAVNAALDDVKSGKTPKVPSHLVNNPTYDDKKKYRYAHDFPGHVAPQQYLPDALKDAVYYKPQTHTKMEAAFAEQHAANLRLIRGKRSE